jgi:hypothetical protein
MVRIRVVQVFVNDSRLNDDLPIINQCWNDSIRIELNVVRLLVVSGSQVEVAPCPSELLLPKRKAYLLRASRHVIVIKLYHGDLLRRQLAYPFLQFGQ